MKGSLKGWLVAALGIGLVAVGLVFALPDWRLKLGFEPASEVAPGLAQQPAAPPATAGDGATSVASAPQAPGETAATPGAATDASATPAAGGETVATPPAASPAGATTGAAGTTVDATATPDAAGDATATPDVAGDVAGQTGDAAATETAAADAAASPEAPAFDLVRVDPEGEAVIAGTAQPGAEVELLIDGVVIASAIAGGDGSFVVLASLGRSDLARALQLRHAGEATAAAVAEEAVELVTAAPEAAADAPAATAESAAAAAEAGAAATETEPAQAGLSAPVVILPSETTAEAPLIVAPEAEQVALLQPAATEVARVVLDRITYAPGGDAVAAGRARPGHAVRAYANAEFVADSPVSASGDWQVTLPRATAETAVLLRFDEVSASGEVTSRLEMPFAYDDGAGTVASRQRRIVVQRGDNLWRIAEQHYGAGIRYSVIFGANSGLIRDPDLIYPGQVFAIPELVATE
ncbi:LysM peptidoglycan-binding domain-containing protein [Limibaculum sp. FT325]|uniref:LysM peptidoglycan-binding domain-containing protein n=1 Tax=Thermohalobaculum sediminis TaxID=2939436 RepID=UPI0020BF2765|nr:LysM peptidoglycan-binding domain-containing protein [Limibaculum sediminis]MCL5775467.1 LysM peptidoglycan-binding domain-containing protein [Limibaculum sediminis]